MRLKNKTALITGGNSGIGLAAAKLFVAEGARVAITGRNQATLDEALASLGPQALALKADAADADAMQAAIAAIQARFGTLDVVFANAGIGGATPIDGTTLESFEVIVRINLTAAFFTVQAALPILNDGASIIFNGSVHAVMGMPGWSAYAAAKAGIRAMTRNLAAELSPRRIRVNQVTPGGTKTPIWSRVAPDAEAMTVLDRQISQAVPLGRMGEADEVARAALFLASNDSTNVQGAEIVVDGGMTGAPQGAPIYRAA